MKSLKVGCFDVFGFRWRYIISRIMIMRTEDVSCKEFNEFEACKYLKVILMTLIISLEFIKDKLYAC